MSQWSSRRPSPSIVISLVALFVALGGSSYAAIKVGTKQLKNNAVTSKKIKNKTIRGGDIRNNAVGASQIAEGKLDKVPNAASADTAAKAVTADSATKATTAGSADNQFVIPRTKVAPTADDADHDAAQAAATKVPLFSRGTLSVYGKCFTSGGVVYAYTYVGTSVARAVYDGYNHDLSGGAAPGDFLNPDSDENDTYLSSAETSTDLAVIDDDYEGYVQAHGADGSMLLGYAPSAAKEGDLESNAAWGPGNVCIFTGEMALPTG